jgi:hypothetical protein
MIVWLTAILVETLGALPVPHHDWLEAAGRRRRVALEQDEPAIGLELVEDQVHDALEQRVAVQRRGGQRRELIDDAQVVGGGLHRVGLGQDHRVLVGVEPPLDGDVHVLRAQDLDPAGPILVGGDAEDHEGGAAADLVAGRELHPVPGDPLPVDERPVGRLEIAQEPPAVVGRELGVAAADRGVGQRQRLRRAPDQLWLVVRQRVLHAAVRALEHVKHQHRWGSQR